MTTRLIENIFEAERLGEDLRDMKVFVVGKLTIDVSKLEPGRIIRLPKRAGLNDISIVHYLTPCIF